MMKVMKMNRGSSLNLWEYYKEARGSRAGLCIIAGIVASIVFWGIGFMCGLDFFDLFIGGNLIYTCIPVVIWLFAILDIWRMNTDWDIKMVKKAIMLKGLNERELLSKLSVGKLFCDKRADGIMIADEYILGYAKRHYYLLNLKEISSVTYDTYSLTGGDVGKIVWLTKTGRMHSTVMNKQLAYQAIAYYDELKDFLAKQEQ